MKTIKDFLMETDKRVTDLKQFRQQKDIKKRSDKFLADLSAEDAAREEHVRSSKAEHQNAQQRAMSGLKFRHPVGSRFTPKSGTKHAPGTYVAVRHTYSLGIAARPYPVYHMYKHSDETGQPIKDAQLHWFPVAGSRVDKEFERQGPRGVV